MTIYVGSYPRSASRRCIGTVKRSPRTETITTDRRFGDWLAGRMGELHRLFQDEETSKE